MPDAQLYPEMVVYYNERMVYNAYITRYKNTFCINMRRELVEVANFVNCLADGDGIDPNLVYLLEPR